MIMYLHLWEEFQYFPYFSLKFFGEELFPEKFQGIIFGGALRYQKLFPGRAQI